MKRCPECNSFCPDAEHFCELDGTPLVSVDDAHNPVSIDTTGALPHPQSNRSILLIGAVAGILLGVLLFLVYFPNSRLTPQENSNVTSTSSNARHREVLQPLAPVARATASPSVEPSVEPPASPGIETPSPENSSAHVELSNSDPISTAASEKGSNGPFVITLDSGVTIEADQAWRTAEGIWYRRHGLVSLLDPKNVIAIEKVSPAAAQSSVRTNTPSP